jgi:hypothetical protein
MAHGVADGGNHHLRHDTHSSASLKVKEPLLGGTSIQTNEYSRLLNAFKNNILPWFTNHAKKTDTDLVEFSTDQETEQSSNIHSSSTPVDHGYGKESSSPTYLHLLTKNMKNHPISTPPPRLWTMDMGKNHHTPTYLHLLTKKMTNHPISISPPHLWTLDMGKNHHTPTFKYLLIKRLSNIPISIPPPRLWTLDM